MPTRKWQSSSGASKNRILGATRLKSEGQTLFPVTLNDNSSNGFALNVQGSNLVLGIGTSEPFSRLSMGNNTDSGIFNSNDTGRLASLALNETSSGGKFSGIFYNSNIQKYYQENSTDISNNGIQIKTTSLNNFEIYESTGGNIFLTNENITTIGGFPRKGITEDDDTDYKGIEKYRTNQQTQVIFGDDPDDKSKTNREGQSKIVLDVRGSLRTDGYINFFNTATTGYGENLTTSSSPSGNWWSTAGPNIPKGSVWLQPTGGGRAEGLWFKTSNGDIRRVEAQAEEEGNTQSQDIMKLGVFNFMFSTGDVAEATAGKNSNLVTYPYVILKGKGAGRVQGNTGEVGGTAFNIRGIAQTLSDIKHERGYNTDAANQKEIFSITQGSMSVTGLSGEEFLIQQLSAGDIAHPMQSYAQQNELLPTDNLGGKVWIERQLLIGSKKSDLNWGLIDVQTLENVPTLLSYNLDKSWTYPDSTRINKRFITQKATNSIILLNKTQTTKGYGDGGSIVGGTYDCSNSIIIGDTFWTLDVPKSLIINVNPLLTVSGTGTSPIGQQVFDDIGGSIVAGYNNWVYKSPYSLVIGRTNFVNNNYTKAIDGNMDTEYQGYKGENFVIGISNEMWFGTENFISGKYHKVSGGGNFVAGSGNNIGEFSDLTKERKNGIPETFPTDKKFNKQNAIFGSNNDISGSENISYSFIAGNLNTVEKSRSVALGNRSWVGGDIRFAFGADDDNTGGTTSATSADNANRFVIDKDGNVGIGTNSPQSKLHIHNETSGTVTTTPSADLSKLRMGYTANGNTWYHELYCGPLPDPNIFVINAKGNSNLYGQISLRTNDIERMHIHSDGNVGIGTTAPKSALQVDAAIFAMGSTAPTKGIHLGMNGNTAIINLTANTTDYSTIQFSNNANTNYSGKIQYYHDDNTMQFFVNNSNQALRLMSNGNIFAPNKVGIGTNSPTEKLEVNGNISIIHSEGSGNPFSTNSGNGICFKSDNKNRTFYISPETFGEAVGERTLIFGYSEDATITNTSFGSGRIMSIKDDGKVGIGTDSPECALDVNGDIKLRSSQGGVGASSFGAGIYFREGTDYRTGGASEYNCSIFAYDHNNNFGDGLSINGNDGISFCTGSNTRSERMRIDINGNVGIGTDSPTEEAKLHINDTVNNSHFTGLYLMNSGTRSSGQVKSVGIKFNVYEPSDVAVTSEIRSAQDDDGYRLDFYTTYSSSTQHTMTLRDGKVGIGTSSPYSKLTVGHSDVFSSSKLFTSGITAEKCYLGIGKQEHLTNSKKIIGFGYINHKNDYYPAYMGYQEMDVNPTTHKNRGDLIFGTRETTNVYIEPTERMRITHTGNVGIGTDSPGAKLEVKYSVYGAKADIIGIKKWGHPNGTTIYDMIQLGTESSAHNSGRIRVFRDGSEKVKISGNGYTYFNGGNVGIGTDSPGQKLSVNGSIMIKGSSSSTTTNNSKIIFSRDITDTDESEYIARIYTGDFEGPLTLEAGRGGGSVKTIGNQSNNLPVFSCEKVADGELFRVCGNGRVGIGTTSPTELLDVNGNISMTGHIYHSGDNNTYFGFPATDTFTITTSGAERMRIDSAGRLLVGTHFGPTYGYSATFAPIATSGQGIDHAGISIMRNSNDYIYMRMNTVGGEFVMQTNNGQTGGNTGKICLQPYGGNVGIGTTSASYKLYVNGTMRVTDTITGNINGNASTVTNGVYTSGTQTIGGTKTFNTEVKFDRYVNISHFNYSTNGDYYIRSGKSAGKVIIQDSGGYCGIGTQYPSYDLHVSGNILADGGWLRTTGNNLIYSNTHLRGLVFNDNRWLRCYGTFAFYNHSGVSLSWSGRYMSSNNNYSYHSGSSTVGIECAYAVVADWFGANSDRRIKKNIVDIDDGDALKILREIPVRYYNYKDNVRKGSQKVSGFIAQEVKEVFPMAVSISPYSKPIPNILKKITNEVWEEITDGSKNKWVLKKFDLMDSNGLILPADISGGKSYKFEMQDVFDKKGDEEIILSDSGGNFIFEKKWKYLFLYGICVDDFLTVDKNKIFAINFSASQEIDRIQQAEKIKVEELEKENSELKTEIEILKTQMSAILARLNTAGI